MAGLPGHSCVVPKALRHPASDPGPPKLSRAQVERFHLDGFLTVDRPFVSTADTLVVRRLLERLFDRFRELPPDLAYDLGDQQHHDGPPQIPEINLATTFEPKLLETVAFARCRDLACQLLGRGARWTYDHAICKPGQNDSATGWHQDLSTAPHLAGRRTAHIWFALQDVNEANGCMQFIPSRGDRTLLLPHARRSDKAHLLVTNHVDQSAAVVCPLVAGAATVHDLATLHFTGPNTSDEPRLAWILHFHERAPRRLTDRGRPVLSKLKRALKGA